MAVTEDGPSYEERREQFLEELFHFHLAKGTPPAKWPPKINGRDVDLYRLYTLVIKRGGWLRVNNRNEWGEVLEDFHIPSSCVNSSAAIKQIYLRFLEQYQKVNFADETKQFGEDSDDKPWLSRSMSSVPSTYNHKQHIVNEGLRECNGLSTDLYNSSAYEKLGLSLISPLPNEQDFAINVCCIMSESEKGHPLKLKQHPKLIHFLLAHAAIFSHPSLRLLFFEYYGQMRGHPMRDWWSNILEDPSFIHLIDESQFVECFEKDCVDLNAYKDICERLELKTDSEDSEIFCFGREGGIDNFVGQRVIQIASIFRNLSFLNENSSVLSSDVTFLRFVLLCCNSRWNNIHHKGWDMLINVSAELTESCLLIEDILDTVVKGIMSEDRGIILSSLEVLNKLCINECNEDSLLRLTNESIYERICSFLLLHDIMLLVSTLECVYSISSLGSRSCNAIVRVRGAVDVLVSLITVEAQSYGPKACIQMKVVETITGAHTQEELKPLIVSSVSHSVVTPEPVRIQPAPVLQPALPPPQPPAPAQPQTPQQVMFENEQLAFAWLKSFFEFSPGDRVDQEKLYKMYVTYCVRSGRRGMIAPVHFPHCVRSLFGDHVGPKPVTIGGNLVYFYNGIRPKPKAEELSQNPSVLKAQLRNPPEASNGSESEKKYSTMENSPLKIEKVANGVSQSDMKRSVPGPAIKRLDVKSINKPVVKVEEEFVLKKQSTPVACYKGPSSKNQEITLNGLLKSSAESAHISKDTKGNTNIDSPLLNGILNNECPIQTKAIKDNNEHCPVVMKEEIFEVPVRGQPVNVISKAESSIRSATESVVKEVPVKSVIEHAPKEGLVKPKVEISPEENLVIKTAPGLAKPTSVIVRDEDSRKRPAEAPSELATPNKKPHLNGDLNGEVEEKVSPSAAQLYAALAADVIGSDPPAPPATLPPPPPPPPKMVVSRNELTQKVIVTGKETPSKVIMAGQPRQVLLTSKGQLFQGVLVNGQQIVFAQPKQTLIQQPNQTVLVTHLAPGNIIMNPQAAITPQKQVFVARVQAAAPHHAPVQSTLVSPVVVKDAVRSQVIIKTPEKFPQPAQVLQKVEPPGCLLKQKDISKSMPVIMAPVSQSDKPQLVPVKPPLLQQLPAQALTSKVSNEVTTNKPSVLPQMETSRTVICQDRLKSPLKAASSEIKEVQLKPPVHTATIPNSTELKEPVKRPNAQVDTKAPTAKKEDSVVSSKGGGGVSQLPPTVSASTDSKAALQAINRNSADYFSTKEFHGENEGPVTKSIRLTAALILRNIVVYSSAGKKLLRKYEQHLATVSLSNVESSRTIAQVLFDLTESR